MGKKLIQRDTAIFPVALLLVFLFAGGCQAPANKADPEPAAEDTSPEEAATVAAEQAVEPPKKEGKVAVAEEPAAASAPEVKPEDAAPTAAGKPPVKPEPAQAASPKPTFGPDDPRSAIYLGSDGKIAGMGDPSRAVSEAFRIGAGSHPQALSIPGLPKDKFGLIDWIEMVEQGVIKPIGSLDSNVPDIPPFDMNVVIKAKGDFVNDVMFQHKTHTYWLSCEICHTGIFIMAKGKNNMTMEGITKGKWCGRCHGKVSFPLTDCNRCHSQPKQPENSAN